MKLLHSKIDTLTKKAKFFAEHNPWMKNYLDSNIPDADIPKSFAHLYDSELSKYKIEMEKRMDQMDLFFKEAQD